MEPTDPKLHEIELLSKEINILIDRVHHEYTKYFAGAEKKPPIQLRLQVDKMAERIKFLQRTNQNHGAGFRAQNAVSKYNTFIAMWDKKLREMESTKS